jgi:hypothetical protein
MFPHLIAGPIVRFAHIREELHTDRRKTGRTGLGLQYFIVGLCQKVLIANTVAPLADQAFGVAPGALDGGTAWLGALAYTLPDLLRLLRLFEHGDRARLHAGLHLPEELRPPVREPLDHRVLAALAHLAVVVVPRLRLHPAGRKPGRGRKGPSATC